MKRLVFGLGALLAANAVAAPPNTSSPENQPLELHVGGRVKAVNYQENQIAYQWPGTYFEGAYKGRRIDIGWDPFNIWNVYIDGEFVMKTDPAADSATVIVHKDAGLHTIRMAKANESQNKNSSFIGPILAAPEPLPAPAPRERQIEFIGDSDMVGYGNTSTKRECTKAEVFETTDSQQAYPAQVARTYNADFQLNAYSGIGIVRNYDGTEPDRPMPVLYPRMLFDDPTPYDRKNWTPQVIVVALGGNDFSTPLKPGEKWKDVAALRTDWETTFVKFLSDIRAQNPDTFLIMGALETFNADYLAATKSVLAARKVAGDARIDLVTYPQLELTACDWHPSLNDHKTMKNIVEAFIDQQPDIWQGK
ncbi:GDSL-type esterase/lipase family protein [Asticcacaulis sp. ZE23SCel15]|uniref:SGNH/GDSL hydrolase family protein n=1 Tax=Asticcacaulis sp. ZE23SCel15 TaxID=3059027 RepID=UPI00265F5EA0|nr:SGNH/GDSL hydrolase family protein [Asticcacaulis sp. ZE23SCel15]WKL57655.1 GDSL-type esterase/lipase family protein [Asticcacaulis sp. ZE23SCel15]